jgi:hypothetical protein
MPGVSVMSFDLNGWGQQPNGGTPWLTVKLWAGSIRGTLWAVIFAAVWLGISVVERFGS